MTGLAELGWTPELEAAFAGHGAAGRRPARILVEHQHAYTIRGAGGEGTAAVSGRFRFDTRGPEDFPAVGDWVAIDGAPEQETATIHGLLPRRSAFTRLAAGPRADAQVVAANIDVVLIAMGLDGDFNLRRLERYLAVGWSSGAMPVVVLTKADRCTDIEGRVVAVSAVAPGVPVLAISALTGYGMDGLAEHLRPGTTAAVLGSSGVGKSTLVNALLGTEALATAEVRAGDDHGRHTTTHRELVLLPGGACIVDTPGMRELGLTGDGDGLGEAFADIDEIASACRFSDCQHDREPGCAVVAAIGDGRLTLDRLTARRKLEREAARNEARRASGSRQEARRFGRMVRDAALDSMARKSAPDRRG
jgi:ribosome biogenesis GTPase / thiamine phosphate phosphatase